MYYNNKKLALSIFWVVLGAVLTALSVAEVLESSPYAGMGGALIAIGALQIARNLKYRKDAAYREKIDVEFGDERNAFLRMKSWAWAGYAVVLIEGIGSVVAKLLGQETVQLVLAYSVCLLILAYWLAYLVLKRKY
ncbi:MAG: hypothetical protein IKN53_06260 [Oscillibacter sp.]|nr:hypothetical protein [Oscillibacter sp.]